MYARDMTVIATPIGGVRIEGDARWIDRIRIETDATGTIAPHTDTLRKAASQLIAWFDGQLLDFMIPLEPSRTLRGQMLRDGMIAIPYGETMSYGELSHIVRSPARAIGQACARNPLPIVVPCHRVLGAGGALGHYSGGDGPRTKQWLLDHERRISGRILL